ncbi:MAG TPA: hypothetical protein DIU11_05695, partial [Pusillimonas sp.]|nr:hypothetical protein [Pusillimonas sp.]
VDVAIRQGFGIAYLAQILGEGGIPFKPSSLKQAVYLWRKKQGANKVRPGSIAAGGATFQVGERANAMTGSTDPAEEKQKIEPGKRQ